MGVVVVGIELFLDYLLVVLLFLLLFFSVIMSRGRGCGCGCCSTCARTSAICGGLLVLLMRMGGIRRIERLRRASRGYEESMGQRLIILLIFHDFFYPAKYGNACRWRNPNPQRFSSMGVSKERKKKTKKKISVCLALKPRENGYQSLLRCTAAPKPANLPLVNYLWRLAETPTTR